MASSPPLAETEHRQQAARHLQVGATLESTGEEWCVVPLFYAAYHLVKAAMLCDPIWSDISRLHAKHIDLIMTDRTVTRHHARRRSGSGAREWGINELIFLLYPQIAGSYERLHQASISVRYGAGLPAGALPDLRIAIDQVSSESAAGLLVAT